MPIGHCVGERGKILCPRLCCGLETGSQLDQRWFAECGTKEADPKRSAKDDSRRHLNDRITRRGSQAGGSEEKVVAVKQVGGPGRVVSGRHNRIEVKLTQCCVNS